MLSVHCPITGINYRLPQFGDKVNKVECLYPLLVTPLDSLLKIPFPYDKQEQYLLTVAYLYQMNYAAEQEIVLWSGPLQSSNLSSVWMSQNFGTIRNFIYYLRSAANSTAVSMLPQLRIDSQTGSSHIQAWLERCNQLKSEYSHLADLDRSSTAGKLFAAHIANRQDTEITGIIPEESQKVRQARSLKAYIERSFMVHIPEKVSLIGKIIFRPNDYEVSTLKQVKALVLDFGLESKLEDFNYKRDILTKIDQVLFDKLNILDALDVQSDKETLDLLRETYSIDIGGTSYHNSVLKNKMASSVIQQMETRAAKVYTTEPKREEYTSSMAFNVAYRSWKLQQS
jgi:hypothetical protein